MSGNLCCNELWTGGSMHGCIACNQYTEIIAAIATTLLFQGIGLPKYRVVRTDRV